MLDNIKKKWDKMSVAKKASLALIFAKFCQKGIAMISTPIFTRIMDTDQFGAITNFTSWQSIIVIIATLNFSQGVFNNGMLEFKNDRNRFTFSALALANLCTVVLFGIYIIFRRELYKYIGLSDQLMVLMFAYMIFYPAFSYWSCRQRYEYKYKLLTIITILTTFLQMVLGVVAVLSVDTKSQALAKLYATEVVLIVTGIIMYGVIAFRARFQVKFSYVKYAFRFNIFLVPHFLAMTVLASGDKVMIASMVGNTETAIYGVSYTAASVINIFWQAIEASWTPWLFEHLSSNNRAPIKDRANQIITIFASISIACMLFAPEIMRILASESYMEGIYIIPSVTAGVFFTAVYALYMRLEYYSKKTKATMVGSAAVAVANVVMNYVFINLFGYMAAGYTTLVCYIFLSIYHYWYSRRIGMNDIYDDKFIIALSVGMIVFSIVVTFTYSFSFLRYGLIGVIGVLCVWKRDWIIPQIKNILK